MKFLRLNFSLTKKFKIMKKTFWYCLALPFAIMACNDSAKDSVEKADSTNEAKSDSVVKGKDSTNANGLLNVDEGTASFMVNVADVGMTEVKLGQMAKEKAHSKRVKEFGAMMVEDHTKAAAKLKDLAAKKNVTLPSKIGEDHQKKIDELSKLSGKDFDKKYMDMMEDGHESTVKDFEGKADNSDPDVKAFVNGTLPTLRMHLDSAKAIKKAL
jgi:putative membrane protein